MGTSGSGNAVALAIALVVVVSGGSYALSRLALQQAQEEGAPLAKQRAVEREAALRQKRMVELLKTLEDSIATHPLDSMMVISAGNISYDLGQFDKAAQYYETFLTSIDPSKTAVRIDYAYALFQSGNVEEGKNVLLAVIAKEPKNQSALFNLAVMYIEESNTEKALETFRECYKADPASDIGKRAALAVQQLETTT